MISKVQPEDFSRRLRARLKSFNTGEKKRVIFPEHEDERVQIAVRQIAESGLCEPIVLSSGGLIGECEVFSEHSQFEAWREKALLAHIDGSLPKRRSLPEALELIKRPLILATTLVKLGYADCGVAGSIASTGDVIKACFAGIGLRRDCKLLSSTFLIDHPDRLMTFADCAVNPDPDAESLAQIAIDSARSHAQLTGEDPKVALLSFSTHGSAQHASVEKVRDALKLVKQLAPEICVDGELQVDSALVPGICAQKAPGSSLAGSANVLIFPDLNSGNIAYKIAERLGKAKAIGPLLQGLDKPWLDLSRGCSVEDIIDATVVAALLASATSDGAPNSEGAQ